MPRVSVKRPFSITSSDTEPYATPVKRHRRAIGSPCLSDNTPQSCRTRKVVGRQARKSSAQDVELYSTLQRCSADLDELTIQSMKGLPRGKPLLQAVQTLLYNVKVDVKKKVDTNFRITEAELYLRWLEGLEFSMTGITNLLNAKVPGTRRRVPGLGRVTFTILYLIIDGFICDVDHHHDGWSSRSSEDHPIYPVTMTLAEEAKDPSTDKRTEKAVRASEAILHKYDLLMMSAVRRFKSEAGKSSKMARAIAQKERSLARACCFLCEQTGYGGDQSGSGESLLQNTRKFMRQWKSDFGITDDDEYDTEDIF